MIGSNAFDHQIPGRLGVVVKDLGIDVDQTFIHFGSIFSEVPQKLRGAGSSLYALFKQISASLGIALSTMALTIAMNLQGVSTLTTSSPKELFYLPLALLGTIPFLALLCCFFIDNKRALHYTKSQDHLETEVEQGIE